MKPRVSDVSQVKINVYSCSIPKTERAGVDMRMTKKNRIIAKCSILFVLLLSFATIVGFCRSDSQYDFTRVVKQFRVKSFYIFCNW